jgi:hypothetical protein
MKQERYYNERNKYYNFIIKQLNFGFKEIDDYHCATSFLIRNMKHKKIIELNSTWYNYIQECGIQCQIAFFFTKQLFKYCIVPFREYPYL